MWNLLVHGEDWMKKLAVVDIVDRPSVAVEATGVSHMQQNNIKSPLRAPRYTKRHIHKECKIRYSDLKQGILLHLQKQMVGINIIVQI